jgi:DNA (cytosine-5)-methyltransferase 1
MTCKWQVEIDPEATKILEKNWPLVQRYKDITEVDFESVERVDIIAGGFPCQDLSTASSTGTGLQGKRSGLWWEMLRAICMVRPRYALLENVAALLNRGMGEVLGSLAENGYDAEWDCLPASEFGAPHERDRVFALAYPNEEYGEKGMGYFQDQAAVFAGSRRSGYGPWLQTTPADCGVDDGLPAGLYSSRVGGLGNAVCPPVAEWIGRRIMEGEK